MRRIRRSLLLRGNHFLPANVHGILAAEFARDLLERLFHTRAILRTRKIDEGLVHKLRNLRFRLSSRHLSLLNNSKFQFYVAPRKPDKTGVYTLCSPRCNRRSSALPLSFGCSTLSAVPSRKHRRSRS